MAVMGTLAGCATPPEAALMVARGTYNAHHPEYQNPRLHDWKTIGDCVIFKFADLKGGGHEVIAVLDAPGTTPAVKFVSKPGDGTDYSDSADVWTTRCGGGR